MVLAVVDVLVWLGAAVLGVAGVLKLRRPIPAALFLRRLGVPASPLVVRVSAVLETAAGILVVASGGAAVLAAAGVLYVAFLASLAGYRLRTGERSVSCGCFGGAATVPLLPHATALLVTLAATMVAAVTTRDSLVVVVSSVAPVDAALLLVLLALTVVAALGLSTDRSATQGPPAFRIIGNAQTHIAPDAEPRGER
jgi:hypothetical protein